MINRTIPWLSLFIGMTIVLSGCNVTQATEQPPVPSVEKQDDIMSAQERDMVILFQSLLQMDKEEGLRLSTQQAQQLLPLVKRNSTDGELGSADQQRMIAILSLNQKKYVDHYQAQLLARRLEKKQLEDMTPEQREQMIKEFQDRRLQKEKEQEENPTQTEPAPDAVDSSPVESLIPSDGTKVPDNVEQQLTELLEDRLQNVSKY